MSIPQPQYWLGEQWKQYERLRGRWESLMQRLKVNDALNEFEELFFLYSDKKRAYHNNSHIEEMHNDFDGVRELSSNPEAIELAIDYHDVIYDVKANDNEERSAEMAADFCQSKNLPDSLTKKVNNLILYTRHQEVPEAIDGKIIIDLDLAIFGKPPVIFDRYDRNIRKEYSWVPEGRYNLVRRLKLIEFFKAEDKGGRIYLTNHFAEKYEVQAKENLERAIEKLGGFNEGCCLS